MKKVVGVGACVLDTVICCGEYPAEDVKYKASEVFSTGGGPVANALVAISRLGKDAEFIGALSADENGKRLKREFEDYGVKASSVKFVENTRAFTSYIVLSEKSGSRTCVFERGNVPDDPENLDFSAIAQADILHLDGNSLRSAIAAAKYAKEKGVKVSLDAGGLYEGIEELLPFVDLLIPSEEFALKCTGKRTAEEAVLELQKRYAPEILVVTQGSKGGVYYEDGEVKTYGSFKVDCVDSNGAGDTFHGAYLVGYMNGLKGLDCCQFASAVAAVKCTKAGVRKALPTMEETQAFIKERK